jgi:hypothetical protein
MLHQPSKIQTTKATICRPALDNIHIQTDRQTFKLKKRGIITGANLPLLIRLSVSSLSTTATHNFLNSPVEKAPQKEGPPLPETLANPYLQREDANDINKQDKKPIEDCGEGKKKRNRQRQRQRQRQKQRDLHENGRAAQTLRRARCSNDFIVAIAGRKKAESLGRMTMAIMCVPERPRTSSPSRVARGTEISVPEQTRVPHCVRSQIRGLHYGVFNNANVHHKKFLFIFLGFPLNDLTKSLRTGYPGNGF